MDTLNFLKAAPQETIKKDPPIKAKDPIVNRDKEDLIGKSNNQDSFSNTLENEISQKNDTQQQQEQNKEPLSGKNLPDKETATSDEAQVSHEQILKEQVTEIQETQVSTLTNKSEVIDLLDEIQVTSDVLDSTENIGELIDSQSNEQIQATIDKISSSQIQTKTIGEASESVVSAAEILKSIASSSNLNLTYMGKESVSPSLVATNKVNLTEPASNKIDPFNLSSLFQGSLNQSDINSSILATTSGFDSSANQQQQNPLMQQFNELQMKLLSQDKQLEQSNFDFTKLTQGVLSLSQNSAITDPALVNQNKTTPELMVKTPVMDRQWSNDFGQHIAFMAKSGGGNALIKLNPAHLGPVEASIKVSNEVAMVQIVATNLTTRDAMDAAIPRLKEMLEEQGFTKVNVDISDKGFSGENEKPSEGSASANNQLADEEEGDFLDKASLLSKQSVIDGVVNYYA